jgi:hypothetical protein
MELIIGFIGYLFLFVGLYAFVLLGFAFHNILTKSYNFRGAISIVLFLSMLFIIDSLFLFFSFSQLNSDIHYSASSFGVFSNTKSNVSF